MSEIDQWIWCDGALRPSTEGVLGAFDPGLTMGLGCFETLCYEEGKAAHLTMHLKRLRKAAKQIDVPLIGEGDIAAAVDELLRVNELLRCRARVRISLYKQLAGAAALVITAQPIDKPSGLPVTLALSTYTVNTKSPMAGVKSTSYADNLLALEWARLHGADEALLLNNHSDLCEGATTNLFWIAGGILFTPSKKTGCLPGITRKVILELCSEHGIIVEKVEEGIESLLRADAVFVSNSVHGIRMVTHMGEFKFPQSQHPMAQKLARLYTEVTGC